MLYLHNDIFLTDIIGYDRLKVSYTPKWNRGYASGTGVATNWGGHFHHSLARGSLPKIDADAVSLHGKWDPTDTELVASRHWFKTGRLLTCWNCLQFHPPHTLHPQWGETLTRPHPSPLDSVYCPIYFSDPATPFITGQYRCRHLVSD